MSAYPEMGHDQGGNSGRSTVAPPHHNRRQMPRRVWLEKGIYRNPANNRLEIQWTELGRVRWRTVDGDLAAARNARREAQRARQAFATVAEQYLASQTRIRRRTHEEYTRALVRHIIPRIGNLPIAAIDEDVIVRVITELEAERLSGWTIRGILVPFGRVLAYAVRRKMIPHNPMRRLERSEWPRLERREMRILRAEEIDALLRAAPDTYRVILATAVFTGLRMGELLGLRWGDVDFADGMLHVRRQYDRSGSYSEPKTVSSRRAVLLAPSLSALLAEHQRLAAHADSPDPVFATATGKPMNWRNVTRGGLATAIANTGLNEREPPLRFHDLRHTYAALLISQGLNVVYVSRQLGHAYPSFTLNTYGGLFERAENSRRAVAALEATFPRISCGSRVLEDRFL